MPCARALRSRSVSSLLSSQVLPLPSSPLPFPLPLVSPRTNSQPTLDILSSSLRPSSSQSPPFHRQLSFSLDLDLDPARNRPIDNTTPNTMPAASAPSRTTVHDVPERRGGRRSRGAKEFSCETCGKVAISPQPLNPPTPSSLILLTPFQVYRHPNCLVKHRWEHNPYWTEASQFLLSKHQQVQLMEAAAILTRGPSLPSDRALWPSYMSDGALPSPAIAADGTPREKNPFHSHSHSTLTPSPTSSAEHPSISDDDEAAEEDRDIASDDESAQAAEDQDDKTDESDVPLPLHSYHHPIRTRPSVPHRATAPVDIRRASLGPARTHHESRSSIGYNPYGPRGISSPRWGVIGDGTHHPPHLATSPPTGHHGYLDQQSAHRTTPTTGKPMAIPTPRSPYSRPQSFSSFSSITQSLGSSSTSSHIPSSSIRSVDAEEEEDDYDEDAYGSYPHYQHAALPSVGSKGLKWSPPQPASRTVYEDLDELEMMDMDMD